MPVAERARGEVDRFDPPGMPRSHRRFWRGPPVPHPCGLRRLLQPAPNASVLKEGFAKASADPTARPALRSAHSGRASSSILPDLVFGRHRSRSTLWRWASEISRQPHGHLGRTGMRSDRSARSAGNASITSSSSARLICAGSLRPTPAIAMESERICPWTRMRRAIGRFDGSASSLLIRSSADFIIDTAGSSFLQAQRFRKRGTSPRATSTLQRRTVSKALDPKRPTKEADMIEKHVRKNRLLGSGSAWATNRRRSSRTRPPVGLSQFVGVLLGLG